MASTVTFDPDPRPSPFPGGPSPSPLTTRWQEGAPTMEGALSVPPDRGSIIGRAAWKVRYVVVGGQNREQAHAAPVSRTQSNRSSAPRDLARVPSEGIFLSIYKTKEDSEPIQQHSITSITDCQVQTLAHRKQGPALPTLVITVVPDPSLDKMRKRRSSRTAGFTAPRETGPTTLLFRPGDDQHTLQDWARFIQQLIQPNLPDRTPLSPVTPASPSFINPFAPRSREPNEMPQRPGSGNSGSRPGFFSKSSGHSHSTRDRPLTFSDSPSLRSKRSDLSSQTSSMNQPYTGFHNYTTVAPTDLPSPATTIGEYRGEFIEGWTSAQGRSSSLNSPIRARDSISSQNQGLPSIPDAISQLNPRETILDRAFQMRRIPGSEREAPGDEKMSSLARFDALMREMDEKRKQREAEEAKRNEAAASSSAKAEDSAPKSAWDEDDSDSVANDDDLDSEDDDDYSDGPIGEAEADIEDRYAARTASAQRALDFIITGKRDPTQQQRQQSWGHGVRAPPSYNHEAFMALSSSGSSEARPQTGYSKNRSRPEMSQRTHSQPHLSTILASSSTPLDSSMSMPIQDSEEGEFRLAPASPPTVPRTSTEKRQSASSAKRLSFTEFTRRLSSTSSLLLVQTNASGGSSRCSNSDMDLQQPPQSPTQMSHHLHPRTAPPTSLPQHQQPSQSSCPVSDRDRCGWRGSVGVFGGGEGGFL